MKLSNVKKRQYLLLKFIAEQTCGIRNLRIGLILAEYVNGKSQIKYNRYVENLLVKLIKLYEIKNDKTTQELKKHSVLPLSDWQTALDADLVSLLDQKLIKLEKHEIAHKSDNLYRYYFSCHLVSITHDGLKYLRPWYKYAWETQPATIIQIIYTFIGFVIGLSFNKILQFFISLI